MSYGLTSQAIVRKTVDAMLATGGLHHQGPHAGAGAERGARRRRTAAGRVDIAVFAIGAPRSPRSMRRSAASASSRSTTRPTALAALKKEFPTGYIARSSPRRTSPASRSRCSRMYYDYAAVAGADVPAARVKTFTAAHRREPGRAGAGPAAVPRQMAPRSAVQQFQRAVSPRLDRLLQGEGHRRMEVTEKEGGHPARARDGGRGGGRLETWTGALPTGQGQAVQARLLKPVMIVLQGGDRRDRGRLDPQLPGPTADPPVHRADAGGGARRVAGADVPAVSALR